MKFCWKWPHWVTASALMMTVACSTTSAPNVRTGATAAVLTTRTTPTVKHNSDGSIRVEPLSVNPALRNAWTSELEREFWQRANQVIPHFAGQDYGNTKGENEKRSYPYAMFDFLAGNRDDAIAFLQSEDRQAKDNQHTAGIDYYYAFTLKGQVRKYFFLGSFLDPAYKQRMYDGAKQWTDQDPDKRSHPIYGKGDGSENGWGPKVRGGWVDGRNTDNLRAMREVSVYLMAEETGNEAVRQLYKQKLQRYVWALYNIGMGEWDSENYHGHTLAAYLNLYDFAKDPEVQQLAKSALDWLSAAGAVKYYRGGFAGPTKRDYGNGNVVFGSTAASLLWHYFGDASVPNPRPERDAIHVITSAYRPPQAIVALARKQFPKPVELLSTKPTYENWKLGGEDRPAYWETTFFGHTYQLGSVVASFADGDVGPFKLLVNNSQRGVDFFVANTGGDRVKPSKNRGDQIGQYRNLLIWLRPTTDTPFFFQLPKSAKAEVESGIWFFQFEQTWLAVYPLNLQPYTKVKMPNERLAKLYREEQTLRSEGQDLPYTGFALEVGEEQDYGSYEQFKQRVTTQSKLNPDQLENGTVELRSALGQRLKLTYNLGNALPTVFRNGDRYDWTQHYDLYQPTQGQAPISLGWKQGTLRVEAGGMVFESSVKSK